MPLAYDPPRMPSSTSPRSLRVLATILLWGATACGEPAASSVEPPSADPRDSLRAKARRTGREPLLMIHWYNSIDWRHDVVRRQKMRKVIGSGAELGVVPFECEIEDGPAAPGTSAAPDWVSNLLLAFPGLSLEEGIDFARLLPMAVLTDPDLRPIAVLETGSLVAFDTAQAAIEEARTIRRRRDAEFAMADFLDGSDRAAALQRGLAALDRWIVVRSYAAELEELAASGDESVSRWAAPLLHEHRVLLACFELEGAMEDKRTISPRRLAVQLAPVVRRYPDLPEVALIAACIQGDAECRLELDDAGVERICERVEAAAAGCSSPWRDIATMWLAAHRR
jgi:hypothetical protein